MAEASLDDLREELTRLEAEEARLSAERDRLHDRIDLGFGSDHTRTREREISDERRQVHQRIDELRERLEAAPHVAGPHDRDR